MRTNGYLSKRFIAGILFFVLLIGVSYYIDANRDVFFAEKPSILFDEDGKIIGKTPFSPQIVGPLGTDSRGDSMLYKVLDGARYTLLMVLSITCISIFVGTILGIILAYLPKSIRNTILRCFEVYFYVPVILWIILFLTPWQSAFETPSYDPGTTIKQFAFVAFVMTPPVLLSVTKEILLLMNKDYIISSTIFGASSFHIFRKHVWCFLQDTIIIVFLQQAIRILTLFIYMGLFNVLIGGSFSYFDYLTDTTTNKPFINEWSSILTLGRDNFYSAWWIPFSPLLMFMISILVLKMMIYGFQSKN